MKMNFKKGFTLIELLVVVAIIGILASVVLASLSTARGKGKNAAILSELSSMREQAELYYATNGNYGSGNDATTASTTGSGGGLIIKADCSGPGAAAATMFNAQNDPQSLFSLIKASCNDGATAITASVDAATATKWALALTGVGSNTFYCVDSNGSVKSYTSQNTPIFTTAGVCP